MKEVLISTKPKWCKDIANGRKKIEVRKSRPKIETPFKCYIYCTKDKYQHIYDLRPFTNGEISLSLTEHNKTSLVPRNYWNGKVIGEFVCDRIDNKHLDDLIVKEDCERALQGTCLTKKDILAYLSYTRGTDIRQNYKMWCFYCWHISCLKIYDKPKELSEFKVECPLKNQINGDCQLCKYANFSHYGNRPKCNAYLTRPPQSWYYVEG